MSIIGEAAPDRQIASGDILILAAWGAIALVVAARMGLLRIGKIVGPARVGDREPLGPIALILLTGFLFWLLLPSILLIATGAVPVSGQAGATQPAKVVVSGPPVIIASMVSSVLALAIMLGANYLARGPDADLLGFAPDRAGRGALFGLGASIFIIWLVYVVANLTELAWQLVQYKHPHEHELLKMLKESKRPGISFALIASAIFVAPVFEEFIFRGFLQTLLTYSLARWTQHRPTGFGITGAFPVILPPEPIPAPVAEPVPAPAQSPAPAAPAWARWVAILITSIAFSAVHEAWSIPPIFVLSVALGYLYERTGNLWVPVTVHAAFNGVSTLIFWIFVMR